MQDAVQNLPLMFILLNTCILMLGFHVLFHNHQNRAAVLHLTRAHRLYSMCTRYPTTFIVIKPQPTFIYMAKGYGHGKICAVGGGRGVIAPVQRAFNALEQDDFISGVAEGHEAIVHEEVVVGPLPIRETELVTLKNVCCGYNLLRNQIQHVRSCSVHCHLEIREVLQALQLVPGIHKHNVGTLVGWSNLVASHSIPSEVVPHTASGQVCAQQVGENSTEQGDGSAIEALHKSASHGCTVHWYGRLAGSQYAHVSKSKRGE